MDFRYSLASAPEARQDGSGCVDHDIWAQYNEGEGWLNVPSRHKTISVPAEDIQAALAAGGNAAIASAYKQALVDNVNNSPVAISGWAFAQMEELVNANNAAQAAGDAADEFISVTLGLNYPVPFQV